MVDINSIQWIFKTEIYNIVKYLEYLLYKLLNVLNIIKS